MKLTSCTECIVLNKIGWAGKNEGFGLFGLVADNNPIWIQMGREKRSGEIYIFMWISDLNEEASHLGGFIWGGNGLSIFRPAVRIRLGFKQFRTGSYLLSKTAPFSLGSAAATSLLSNLITFTTSITIDFIAGRPHQHGHTKWIYGLCRCNSGCFISLYLWLGREFFPTQVFSPRDP